MCFRNGWETGDSIGDLVVVTDERGRRVGTGDESIDKMEKLFSV